MLISELLEEYLLEIDARGQSKTTIKTTKDSIDTFIKFTGDISIFKVNKIIINKYIIDQRTRCKNNTINNRIIYLRGLYKYAVEQELIEKSPFKNVEFLKKPKVMIKTYSPDDIQKILGSLKGRDFLTVRNRTLITLLVETGIRNSELCGIKLEDVYEGSIRILGKGNKIRFVPISKPLRLQLLRYMRVRNKYTLNHPSDYLFVNRLRQPMTRPTLLKAIKDIGKKLGVDVATTIHNFRRYFAQQLLNDVDIYIISRLLGHSHLATTELYIRSIEDTTIVEKGATYSPLSKKK
ncbi:hypothetical protein E2K98_21935 [Bacillus salipaludis]|uniref:Tyrosine-type recombinase/integrase n=1 Tax=Bacillus salipaludis TaxID=2547811 RepID=A0A4V3AT91_9BACI|nr:tyrosine-type recombinase/integrase [Bacillus salipaludis]MDQ6599228.1 tyrosine-type recombinase/integrase [Bacillus salipaludis]TDK58872.1 hypothetical protein E2K98_21935 [Bacillus salipaludis]